MARRWSTLKRDIDLLREQFLPDPFDPLGVYPNARRIQAHTRAFLVLSHAEIETYLEEWAKDIARAAEVVWTNSQRIVTPLAFLLSWSQERLTIPDAIGTSTSTTGSPRLAEITKRLFPAYYKRIKDNDGVKEKNVLNLFAPLGISSGPLAGTLLPNLDALGTIRGTHAHHSVKAVTSVLDPETEYKRIIAVVTDLAPFEQWLVEYRRKIR